MNQLMFLPKKYFYILVRFLSSERNDISTQFLCLLPIQEVMNENIFNLTNAELKVLARVCKTVLVFVQMVQLNMVGCNNFIWTRLSAESP